MQSVEALIGCRWVDLEISGEDLPIYSHDYEVPACVFFFSLEHFLFGIVVFVGRNGVFCFVCKEGEVQRFSAPSSKSINQWFSKTPSL